jgi:hypothetical protein
MIATGNTLLQQHFSVGSDAFYLTRQHPNFMFKCQNVLHGASAVQLIRLIPWNCTLKNLGWNGVYEKGFQKRTFEVLVGSQRSAEQSYAPLTEIVRLKRQLF